MTVMKSFAALFAIIVGLSQVTLAGEGHSSPALDSINGQIAAFQKQIDDLAAKAATEKQKLDLQKQAKVVTTKIHFEATQSIEKTFQAQTKPIRDNIATLRLRAFEIQQESGMAEPATGKRTNTPARAAQSSPALDSINGQIAAFQKQIDDLAAKAATEKQKLNLQKQAKVISTKIHYEATQSIEKIFQAQTKPIRDNIATLRLRAFEIRQESGMAEPATGKRKR